MFLRYVGGQFFDERSSSGEYLFGLFPACLSLIKLAQGNTNPPVPWSQPLYMRCFLRGSQHRFGFRCSMKRGQGFAAQFPQMWDDTLARQVGGGGDQLLGDVQGQARVTASQGQLG